MQGVFSLTLWYSDANSQQGLGPGHDAGLGLKDLRQQKSPVQSASGFRQMSEFSEMGTRSWGDHRLKGIGLSCEFRVSHQVIPCLPLSLGPKVSSTLPLVGMGSLSLSSAWT